MVVRVLPIPKSQEEATQEQSERESEATTKRLTIWLTGLTVLVGAGQIYMIKRQAQIAERQNQIIQHQNVIMAGQRAAADQQSEYMRDGLQATRDSIGEAAKSASAMESIAASMALSAESVQQSLAISKEIADTNRRIADDNAAAFVANNRAFLHVLKFGIEWGQENSKLIMVVSNSGRYVAIIRGWAATCTPSPLPQVLNRDSLVHHGNAGPVAPDNGVVTLQADIPLHWSVTDWQDLLKGKRQLSIWGVITYDTGFPNVPGETGFGFEFLRTAPHPSYGDRFATSDVPGYNYAR